MKKTSKKSLSKIFVEKSVVLAIVAVFIGSAFVPAIGSQVENITNELSSEDKEIKIGTEESINNLVSDNFKDSKSDESLWDRVTDWIHRLLDILSDNPIVNRLRELFTGEDVDFNTDSIDDTSSVEDEKILIDEEESVDDISEGVFQAGTTGDDDLSMEGISSMDSFVKQNPDPLPLSRGSHTFGYSGTTDADATLENRLTGTWGEAVNGSGTADYIIANLRVTTGTYSGKITAGLYEYVDWGTDYAGNLVAQTEVKTITSSSSTSWWEQFNFTGTKPSIANNTKYYITLSAEDDAGGIIMLRGQGTTPGYSVFESITYSDTLEDPWVGESSSSYRRAIYCSYHIGNLEPDITDVTPSDNSMGINRWPSCSVTVTDNDDDTMTVEFFENTTGSWVLQQTNSSVSSGSSVVWSNFSNASEYNTEYRWRVCVFDGSDWTNDSYSFTTEQSPDAYNFGYLGATDIGAPLEDRQAGSWGEAVDGSGTADYIMVHLGSDSGSYSGNVTAGLYEYVDYSSSYAGDLIAQTEVKTITVSSTSSWWERFDFTGIKPSIIHGTKYYLAVSGEDNGLGTDYDITVMSLSSDPGYSVFENIVYSDTLEDPWVGEASSGYHRAIYCSYTVEGNNPPALSNELPVDDSTGVGRWPQCNVTVTDDDDDSMTVEFYENTTGSWVLQQTNSSVSNGTSVIWGNFSNASEYNNEYRWRVCVFDGTSWMNETYGFTTISATGFTLKWTSNIGATMVRLHSVADVNGDGVKDVIIISNPGGFIKALSGSSGSELWAYYDSGFTMGGNGGRLEVADLNNDGIPEVLCGLEPAGLVALYGNNGSVYWKLTGLDGDSLRSNPVVFDLDGDGYPTVFACPWASWDEYGSTLYSISYDGIINLQNNDSGHTCAGGLSIMDYDNDGHFEIYLGGSWGGIDARVQSFWAENLTLRWESELLDGHYSPGIPVLADTNGDGIKDVINVHSNPAASSWYEYRVFSAENGSTLQIITPGGNYHLVEPAVYDIDDDGHNELIDAGSFVYVVNL